MSQAGPGTTDFDAITKIWGELWQGKAAQGMSRLNLADHNNRNKLRILSGMVANLPQGAKICELGCGDSQWLVSLRDIYGDKFEYYGVDGAVDAIKISKGLGINATQCDVRQIPFPDRFFDVTFSWGVMEHFYDTNRGIQEQARITKHTTLIDVPNKMSLAAYWGHRMQKQKGWTDEEYMYAEGKHYYPWVFKKLILDSVSGRGISCVENIGNYLVFPPLSVAPYMNTLDRLCPHWIRKYFGANTGFVVHFAD